MKMQSIERDLHLSLFVTGTVVLNSIGGAAFGERVTLYHQTHILTF